jgi:uncharacterized RDD family membrane protein YckC
MSNDTWFYARGSQQFGPVTLDVLRGLAQSGQLWPNDLVWVAGMTNWVEARLAQELAPVYHAAAMPGAPPPMPPFASPMASPGAGTSPYPVQYCTPQPAIAYAGFWLRFVAYIIDTILLNVVSIIPGFIFGVIYAIANGGRVADNDPLLTVGAYTIGIVIAWIYFALMESSSKQATLGKMALGLTVTDEHGRRVSFKQASGRFFGKILSGLIFGVGFMMAGFTERRQALHDTLAKTLVVRRR